MDSIDLIAKGLNEKDLGTIIDYISQTNSNVAIERIAEIATKGFMYEPTEGAWAIISERFVEATPENSVIKCYTNNANLERTWAQVEVVTILDKLPDEQVVGNTTVTISFSNAFIIKSLNLSFPNKYAALVLSSILTSSNAVATFPAPTFPETTPLYRYVGAPSGNAESVLSPLITTYHI